MSHWNYRVIEFVDLDGTPWRGIFEVHYDEAGNPREYSEEPARLASDMDNNDDLAWALDRMKECLVKPVLVERDFQSATK